MRRSHAILMRLVTLAFLLLCLAPAGLGAGSVPGSARAAVMPAEVTSTATASATPAPIATPTAAAVATATGTAAASATATGTAAASATATATKVIVSTLSVVPTSFSPQDDIQVSGGNFGPGELITISLTSSTASLLLGQVQANSTGGFGPYTVRVPFGVLAGTPLVVATGKASNRTASVTVTVRAPTPTLSINPASVKPGDMATATGAHFQPGETLTLDLVALSSSTRLATATVDSAGHFTITSVHIPLNTPKGTVTLVATGTTSHLSATAQLAVGALPVTLTLAPSTLIAGSTLNVTGAGFIPGETVSVRLSGGNVSSMVLASAVVGTTGSFSIAKLAIPAFVSAGAHTVTASGQTSGRAAVAVLTVQAPPAAGPILSILGILHTAGTPYLLSPGSLVQIAGSHFTAGSSVTLTLAGSSSSVVLATVKTAGNGTLGPASFTMPVNTAAGSYTLQAMESGKKVASLDVKVSVLTPHLTVLSGVLQPGTTLIAHGSGFAAGEQVVLALNGAALLTKPTTVLADAGGAFTVTVVVPGAVTDGTNILTAIGAVSRVSGSLSLQASVSVATHWYFAHGDTTGSTHTLISLLNPSGATASVKLTFLYQSGPERSTTQRVPAHSQLTVDLGLAAGTGRQVSTIVEADRQIGAESSIDYSQGDRSTALGVSAPSTTWYLAEGYTNASFREQLAVMNPATTLATIDVRFLPFNGRPPKVVRFAVQPRSEILIDAGQYMPGQSISAIVTADKGIVVERSMRFGAAGRGAHDKIGVTSASTVWLFAQGQTAGDHQTFFTILNPNQAAAATVTATFFDHAGKPIGSRTVTVDALRRGNIKLNDVLSQADVAAILTSNVPVVIERPDYNGPANLSLATSGSVVFGRNGGGLSWMFPGGSTANGTQSTIFLFNPGLKVTTVHATFYTASGAMVTRDLTLLPNSDTALNVNTVPGLAAGRYGAVLKSSNNQVFLAEQSELNTGTKQATSTQGVAQ